MRTIEATATISRDRKLVMPVPGDILPGNHRVVVVIEEQLSARSEAKNEVELPIHDLGPWPPHLSLRREELYGDDGR